MSSSEDSPNASAIPSSETVDNMDRYKPLYDACVTGDWDLASDFLQDNPYDPNLWTTGIDAVGNPALCVAALYCQTEVFKELVQLIPENALLAKNKLDYTALHYIAKNGDVEAAKILVTKNPLLTQIPNYSEETPLLFAAEYGCKEMVRYLVTVTKDEASDRWPSPFKGEQGAALLVSVINFDLYDVALDLVQNYDGIAAAIYCEGNRERISVITALAMKSLPESAMSGADDIAYANSMRKQCLDFVDGVYRYGHQYSLLLHKTIKYKQKEIFHHLKQPKFKNMLSDVKLSDEGDSILHLAANISPYHVLNKIHGAALQVQHDVKWYKEVATMVPIKNTRNRKGWTPEDLFYEEHRALMREGEKWMQNIASSSMVVATLIATVVFAAAFTVPGGTRSDMGLPFFLNKMSYLVFAVSNAMALIFSLTFVLIFLSIRTATYGMEDFLISLPQRLIIGEVMLFLAIATMTMAFGATYFIMLGHKLGWLSILIVIFISLPVILFVILQAPHFCVIFKATYSSL